MRGVMPLTSNDAGTVSPLMAAKTNNTAGVWLSDCGEFSGRRLRRHRKSFVEGSRQAKGNHDDPDRAGTPRIGHLEKETQE